MDDGAGMERAIEEARGELDRSQHVQSEISRMMGLMAEKGRKQSPEYQQVFAAYQHLSKLITEAARELRTREDEQLQAQRAGHAPAEGHDFDGLVLIKGTLGMPGQRGVVADGEEVSNLQRFLGRVGYPVSETGKFDNQTRQALLQFQGKYGLQADGKVGASTRKVINDLLHGR